MLERLEHGPVLSRPRRRRPPGRARRDGRRRLGPASDAPGAPVGRGAAAVRALRRRSRLAASVAARATTADCRSLSTTRSARRTQGRRSTAARLVLFDDGGGRRRRAGDGGRDDGGVARVGHRVRGGRESGAAPLTELGERATDAKSARPRDARDVRLSGVLRWMRADPSFDAMPVVVYGAGPEAAAARRDGPGSHRRHGQADPRAGKHRRAPGRRARRGVFRRRRTRAREAEPRRADRGFSGGPGMRAGAAGRRRLFATRDDARPGNRRLRHSSATAAGRGSSLPARCTAGPASRRGLGPVGVAGS
jgi:hypothetical protein